MQELVAIAYPDDHLAALAQEEVGRCAEELMIEPDAVSVLVCEHDGGFRLTTSRRPGATAPWSKFWSALLGAVVSGGELRGLDRDFAAVLRQRLRPGTSALLLAVAPAGRERALEALSPFDGQVLACSISSWDRV